MERANVDVRCSVPVGLSYSVPVTVGQTPQDRAATLYRYVELFLDEVESRNRELDAEEGERLADILVHLATGQYDRCESVMRRLETLLAVRMPSRRAMGSVAGSPTITEYRDLLKLVRDGN